MLNKWSCTDIDELLGRGGEGRLLYQGPEGRVARWGEEGVIVSDVTGPELPALLRRLGLGEERLFCLRGPGAADCAHALGLKTGVPCTQWVYTLDTPPQVPEADVRPLTEDYAALCAAHYHPEDDDPSYMLDRIRAGRLWGLFVEGQLAAFIGMHHEGSMGILEVLPAYRRRGLGAALEGWLIAWQLRQGWRPYCHVYLDNGASHALQARLGLTPAPDPVVWAWRPDEEEPS